MYSRIAAASCSIRSMRCFTRSPIETIPTRRPSATTGKWRTRRCVIKARALSTGVDGSTVIAGARHHAADRPVENLGAMVAQTVDHVAFRHDPRDPVAFDNRQGADPSFAEYFDGIRDGRVRGNCRDLRSLVPQDHLDVHCSLRIRSRLQALIVPLRAAKGKAMPHPDPIPSPRLSMLRKFRQIMKWMALFSIAVAAHRRPGGRLRRRTRSRSHADRDRARRRPVRASRRSAR